CLAPLAQWPIHELADSRIAKTIRFATIRFLRELIGRTSSMPDRNVRRPVIYKAPTLFAEIGTTARCRKILRKSYELLKEPVPDTFLGRRHDRHVDPEPITAPKTDPTLPRDRSVSDRGKPS